jgi:hypothetical protein
MKRDGYLLIGMLILSIIVIVSVPILINLLQYESKVTIKRTRNSTATVLAESAMEKALLKIGTDSSLWPTVQKGIPITGFNDDMEHTDIAGGVYKILLSSGPQGEQVTILVKARDTSGKESRSVRAVFERFNPPLVYGSPGVGLYGPSGVGGGTLEVHWAPIVADLNFFWSTIKDLRFPRKISSDKIENIDATNSAPNTDNTEWWSFDSRADEAKVPPAIDWSYYRGKAQASAIPSVTATGKITAGLAGIFPAVASPPNSGYFRFSMNSPQDGALAIATMGNDNVVTSINFQSQGGGSAGYKFKSSTSVIFIEDDHGHPAAFSRADTMVSLSSYTFLDVEALIVGKSLTYINGVGGEVFGATVPTRANIEYGHPTGNAVWTAGGGASMASAWAKPTRCCYNVPNTHFHGLLYSSFPIRYEDTPPDLVGVFWEGGSGWHMCMPLHLYFDEQTLASARVLGVPLKRLSWDQVAEPW